MLRPAAQVVMPKNVQVFVHGGMAVSSGHGCINDLWSLDLRTCTWHHHSCSGDRQTISNKVAAHQVVPMSACGHGMSITGDGAVHLYGGLDRNKELAKTLQVLVPLAQRSPGGNVCGVAPDHSIPRAGMMIALAHARCAGKPVVLQLQALLGTNAFC